SDTACTFATPTVPVTTIISCGMGRRTHRGTRVSGPCIAAVMAQTALLCGRWARASLGGHRTREGERSMMACKLRTLTWGMSALLVGSIALRASAQQVTPSDLHGARQGAIPLAAAHGEKPRYGGKFLSAGNEEVPFYDLHQTSLGGVYAAVAPAYNCLIRTSPYDPMAMDIIPELA